ncbi:MAG: fused MFS/spermidine synthase [Planctomycetota bacterium]|nr:fused MFS/spermidine synthase [Planctomycetota bacterium]
MLGLFASSIFLGAFLLFLVQPMVGKLILPLLGGSPNVWTTVMLYFQAMLLAGYGYAHALSKLKLGTRVAVHIVVALAPLALLPIGLPGAAGAGGAWMPDPEGFQAGSVLLLLAAATAGPVFVLCSVSSTLQSWFSATGHRAARDPYFLYGASNAGSMAALLAYPVLVEPWFPLTQQRWAWSIAYAGLAVMLAACGISAWRAMRRAGPESRQVARGGPAVSATPVDERARTRERLMWLALSLVPAGLMMGATQHITTDIAAVPLLWILPLTLYLLTYIVAFSQFGPRAGRIAAWLVPVAVVAVGVMAIVRLRSPTWLPVSAHLVLLAAGAMACHGRLASLRPSPTRLTEFYLMLSVGGVLAGIICGITAPAVFNGVVEYPLFIVAACLLRPTTKRADAPRRQQWSVVRLTLRTVAWMMVVGIVPAYVFMMAWLLGPSAPSDALRYPLFQLCWIVPAALTLAVLSRRWLYAAAVVGLLAIPWFDRQLLEREILQIRTFFGVHRVVAQDGAAGVAHLLFHGTTEHGRQWRSSPFDRQPMAYFTRTGPVGDVFAELDRRAREEPSAGQRVAVIGLGAGTLAAYGRAERAFTFYEIDPVVKDIATDPDLFSYLAQSDSPIDFVLGDARLTIARAEEAAYDLIAMDAFSSDAVPIHLISREAVAAYLRALRPGGLLMFNVSNRHIRFEPVLSRLAEDAGLVGMMRDEPRISMEERRGGKQPSAFIVLARRAEDLGLLAADTRWRRLEPAPAAVRLWTDDYSDLLSVVKWR